jgi:hypothetical protein
MRSMHGEHPMIRRPCRIRWAQKKVVRLRRAERRRPRQYGSRSNCHRNQELPSALVTHVRLLG